MGFLDKAKDMLGQHDDKVDQALDKAGEHAKGRFAGHDEHIDKAVDFAQQRTGEGDTTEGPPPEQAPLADENQPPPIEPAPADNPPPPQ